MGLADWAKHRRGDGARAKNLEVLDRYVVEAAPGLDLLPRGWPQFPASEGDTHATVDDLLVWMAGRGVVVDAGDLAGHVRQRSHSERLVWEIARASDHNFAVTRPCALAARRGRHVNPRPSGLVVVGEDGHEIESGDLAAMWQIPVKATIPASKAVARSVDAGMIAVTADSDALQVLGGLVAGLRRTRGMAASALEPVVCERHDQLTVSSGCGCWSGGCVSCAGPGPVFWEGGASWDGDATQGWVCDSLDPDEGLPCGRPIIEWHPAAHRDPQRANIVSARRRPSSPERAAGIDVGF